MPRLAAIAFSFALLSLGCRLDPERTKNDSTGEAPPARFGKPLKGVAPTPLAEVLAHPDRYADTTIAVEGHVARACSRKGCWMEIADSKADSAPSCRVTFENYAFFVPKDSPGSRARLEGKVVTSRMKPSHVEHLESEGARVGAKEADGSALEVQIVATGVELTRPGPSNRPAQPNGAQGS